MNSSDSEGHQAGSPVDHMADQRDGHSFTLNVESPISLWEAIGVPGGTPPPPTGMWNPFKLRKQVDRRCVAQLTLIPNHLLPDPASMDHNESLFV